MPHPDNKPAVSKEPISIALPVHNQASQLEPAVRSWLQFLRQLARPFEFIIVDDGSSDQTGLRAQSLAGQNPEIVLIQESVARGYGASLRSALAKAQYPLFFYTSLDYPYAPSDLRKLLDRIDDVDLVSGYRSAQRLPPLARALETVINFAVLVLIGLKRDRLSGWLGWNPRLYYWLVRVLLGVHVQDVDSAFKLFRREVFDRIPIQSDGVLVHAEIIAKANFMTCWMDEIPVGAASGATPEALAISFSWREHFRGMRRLLGKPAFGPPVLPSLNAQEKPANPPAAG